MDQKGQCRFLCSIRKWGLFVKSALMLIAPSLYALPEGQEVVQGTADCTHPDPQSMCIQASDQAIINYQKFSIGSGERVQFIQPSSHSSVLNRVTGTDPSAILGSLQSNGRVFLVNPQGIYFGKDAVVNVGGLVASTLNIRDEDFAQGNYRFYLEDGSLGSQIVNEGRISAETSVALFAPYIDNLGSIIAQTGTIAMGSAQRITLDFSGDGLISFCVDETLSEALIRQGVGGSSPVRMDFAAAERTIKMVVNTDGLTAANTIEESEGVFRLVNTGSMNAAAVSMDGPRVALTGLIDVSNLQPEMTGGRVEVFGDRIDLRGARIDASGDAGGGTVLIGGEYQGKGSRHNARTSVMDENSWIHADAITSGDGGKVVVWADDAALFYGTISARGNEGGQGGLVETSGKQNLGVGTLAHVDTWAPNDRYGNWLLDPASITIATGGGATIAQCSSPNCADANVYTLAPNTIAASATNVSLCAMNAAASFITVSNNISMTNSGVGLTLTAGSGSAGPINLNANITTRGGAIVLNGVMTVGANVALSTINATPAGSSITLNGTVNASGTRTLTLGGGTSGTVTLAGAVGATTSLNTLTATGATVAQNSSVRTIGNVAYTGTSAINIGGSITTTASGSITLTGPVNLTNTPTLDTTFAGATTGATISFTSTLNGAVPLVLRAGTVGNVIFGGIVGGSSPLTNLSFTSANQIRVGNNITVTGANLLTFPSAVLLNGTSTIQSNLNNNISFNSTINAASLGVQGLTVTTGSGLITLSGAVGATTALNSLSTTAATVTQSSSVRTTGSVSHTGTSAINIGGSITTTASGSITLTGPVIITNTPTLDTTNAGGTTGANIRFTSTLDGAVPLVLRSGTVGNVIFSGIVGGTNPLTNLSFTSANQIQIGNDIRVTGTNVLTFPGASAVIVNGSGLCTVTSNSNNTITFGGTINGPQALAVVTGAGAITFSGAIGGSTLPASLAATATGGTVTQSSTAIVTGAVNYTASTINVNGSITTSGGAITCTGNTVMANAPTFSTTSADITFSANLNGATAPTFLAGTGVVTFGGAVGNAVVPTNLTFTSASLIRVGGNVTVTGANPLNFSQPTAITGISTFLTNNAAITFGNTLIGPQALTITAGSGAINFNSTVGGTPLSSLTITSASTVTASGSISAGTITESGVSNLSTFHALTTSAIGGISLTGNQFSIDGNIITTGSGPCSITNAGLLTLIGGSSTSISGAFNQNGAGAVSLSGKILTTGTNLSFLRAITLAGATQLASGGGTIALSSTVDGAGDLTLTAGSGAINLSGAIGATRIGAFLIQSAGPVTTSSIRAASITQASGSTTTFGGALNTNGNSGISLTGTDFNLNGTITTTTSGGATTGSCTINNSGALTLPLAATANIAGSFEQTNSTGTVSLANAITAGESISFRGPVTVAGSAAELSISAASQSITLYNTEGVAKLTKGKVFSGICSDRAS